MRELLCVGMSKNSVEFVAPVVKVPRKSNQFRAEWVATKIVQIEKAFLVDKQTGAAFKEIMTYMPPATSGDTITITFKFCHETMKMLRRKKWK